MNRAIGAGLVSLFAILLIGIVVSADANSLDHPSQKDNNATDGRMGLNVDRYDDFDTHSDSRISDSSRDKYKLGNPSTPRHPDPNAQLLEPDWDFDDNQSPQ